MPSNAAISATDNRYDVAFVLDESKLSRIFAILDGAAERLGAECSFTISALLKSRKIVAVASLADLLRLDNSLNNEISELRIAAKTAADDGKSVFTCNIDFESRRGGPSVTLAVVGSDSRLAQGLFAELEEQVERTFSRGLIYRMRTGIARSLLVPITVLSISFAAMVYSLVSRDIAHYTNNKVTASEAERLLTQARKISTVEEKLAFLVEAETARLKTASVRPMSAGLLFQQALTVRALLVEIPLLFLAVALVYLWAWCYPLAVFSWGDAKTQYEDVLSRRRFVWNAVIVAFAVGVLGSVFMIGVSGYLKP